MIDHEEKARGLICSFADDLLRDPYNSMSGCSFVRCCDEHAAMVAQALREAEARGFRCGVEAAMGICESRAKAWHDEPKKWLSSETNAHAHDEAVHIWRAILALVSEERRDG